MRPIAKIIIHCSDSKWGDVSAIDDWHKARGWAGIGYHWVVVGGFPKSSKHYIESYDGLVQRGRPEEKAGAHCRGQNRDSIGICMIGVDEFTPSQFEALERVVRGLQEAYNVSDAMVFGHRDWDKKKTCPNFDVSAWMKGLKKMP